MPLKLVLRPGEKMIVNGAVIGTGDHPVSLFFYNKVNFLRGREILKEEQCDSIEKKLYFVIQLIYIFPEDAALNLSRFAILWEEARLIHPTQSEMLEEIRSLVEAGNYYRALKLCRKLFPPEPAEAVERPAPPRRRTGEAVTPVTVTKVRRRPPAGSA